MSASYFKIIDYPSRVYAKPQGSVNITIRVGNYGEEAGVFHINVVDYNNNIVYTSESITLDSAETTDITLYFTAPNTEETYTYKLQAFNEDNNRVDDEASFTLVVKQAYPVFKVIEYTNKITTAPLQQYNITVRVQNNGDEIGRVVVKLMEANKSRTIQSAEYELEPNATLTHMFSLTSPYSGESLLYTIVLYNETNDTIDDEKYVFVYVIADRPIFRVKEIYVFRGLLVAKGPSWDRVVVYPNEKISYSVIIKNIGDRSGTALVLLKDESGAVIDSMSVNIAKYSEGTGIIGLTAPADAWTRLYTIEIYNVDVGGVDDRRAFSLRVLKFNTSIELMMPDKLKPNATAWVYGRLKTSDGLKTIGLEGQEVKITINGAEYVVKTKVGGYFRLEITTPASGTLNIAVAYDGQYKFNYMTSEGLQRDSIQLFYPSQTSKTITIDPDAPAQSKPSVIPEDIVGEHTLTTWSNGFNMLYNVNSVDVHAGFRDERGAPLGSPIPVKIYKNGQYYKDAEWHIVNIWDSVSVERLLNMVSLVYEGSSAYSSFLFNMLIVDYMDADLPPEPEQPETPPPPQQTKSLKIVGVDYPSTVRPNTEFSVSVSVKNLTSNMVNAVVSINEPFTYTSESAELTLYANEVKTVVFTLVSGSKEELYTYTIVAANKATGLTEDAYTFTINVSLQAPPTTTEPTKILGIPLWVIILVVLLLLVMGSRRRG
jgi:hypothetical protein